MDMYVDPLLLWMITNELNNSTSDVISNFNMYHKRCIECPPNITRNTQGKMDFNCWVLRGFYPDTNILFRMTTAQGNHGYFIKIVLPDTQSLKGFRAFSKQDIDTMANDVLLDSTTKYKKLHTPKLMTPKGMKPLKWRKK